MQTLIPRRLSHTLLFTLALAMLASTVAWSEEYQLDIALQPVHVTGKSVEKITVNGTTPGPTLYFTEGEEAIIHVNNHLNETTSVHWHGILLPGEMDGVQGLNNYSDIAAGATFTYRFKVRQNGTYWYHAHTNGQEQDGLYGAMIFKPRDKEPVSADRDYIVMLSEFSNENSADILANLKTSSDYYNRARRTVGDFFHDIKNKGWRSAWKDALDWGNVRMSKTDLADVSGYTFLVNGLTPQQNWTGLFKPGEKVRLRFINASAMSFYDVRLVDKNNQALRMSVVAADGQNVEALPVDEFRIGVAETYDVIVAPVENKAYTIVAEPIDRSGFALATLLPKDAAQDNMKAVIPAHRPRTQLTMADMGMQMDMSEMDHANMSDTEIENMTKDMTSGWADAGTPAGNAALSYANLRYAGIQKDTRAPERTIDVHLGGNMQRYIWTMNGKNYEHSEPIKLHYGERVRLTFINDTMMAHPMHLHGMFVQLENGQPAEKLPNKHTVIVAPGQRYSVLLTANEPGEWAFHCHLLYHMASGMMTKIVVAKLD